MIEFIVGSSLAAAAGLNAWMPLFLLGLADRLLPAVALPGGWSWLSSDLALWVVGVLLVFEIVADKVPALDSVNDVLQSIVRPAAGGIAFGAGAGAQTIAVEDPASLFADGAWGPVVAGVVIALVVHVVKATARLAANTATGGLAAPVLSTAEDGFSFLLAAAAIIVPAVAALLLIALVVAAVVLLRRRARRRTDQRTDDALA